MLTTEAIDTQAGVLSNSIEAGAPILARIGCTVVGVDEAVPALVALGAGTFVGAIGVDARGFVTAR